MRSQEEQIEALLRGDLTAWIQEQIMSGAEMDDLNWYDFFSVTPDDLVARVMAKGFPIGAVWEPGHPMELKNERLVVERDAQGRWRVYFTERDSVEDERTHATREEAVRDAVSRIVHDAWVSTSANYWHAHHKPGDVFPRYGGALPSK